MKSIFSKIKRVIKDPWRMHLDLLGLWRLIFIKRVVKGIEVFYSYRGELYPEGINDGNRSPLIAEKAKEFCKGNGIDVGAGERPFPGAIPVEDELKQNAYKLDNFPDGTLDYVFSSHCLEHLKRWDAALKLWIKKLKRGGILFLYLPHESMRLWNPGSPWVGSAHKWIPTYGVLNEFLSKNGMEIINHDPDRDRYWSFYIVAKKNGLR
ncbi:MAG: methyltransferase domain-containing protein [Candidatus Omnitrophica bacterium]|nr:methyltransferase domain-containing protein [Candidatus Omnitrophota bacterium]